MIGRAASRALGASLLVSMLASAASAIAFTNLYAFGDSLTDTGNYQPIHGACPSPPYYECGFSNGPAWIEHLGDSLGIVVSPGFSGGNNFAVGGAETTDVLSQQIPEFSSVVGASADPGALYAIWAGGNDGGRGSRTAQEAADNVIAAITDLSFLGAQSFLVLNLPSSPQLAGFAEDFNAALATGLAGLTSQTVFEFDVAALYAEMVGDPGAYGFSNITDPCYDHVSQSVCADPDAYLRWDTAHPTAATHAFVGAAAFAATPEPGTGALVALGLAGLAVRRRLEASAFGRRPAPVRARFSSARSVRCQWTAAIEGGEREVSMRRLSRR